MVNSVGQQCVVGDETGDVASAHHKTLNRCLKCKSTDSNHLKEEVFRHYVKYGIEAGHLVPLSGNRVTYVRNLRRSLLSGTQYCVITMTLWEH